MAEAHRLVGLKSARDYTSLRRDIQEADATHLEQAAALYDRLAEKPSWVRIDCTNAESGKLGTPEEIHRAVLKALELRGFFNSSSSGALVRA